MTRGSWVLFGWLLAACSSSTMVIVPDAGSADAGDASCAVGGVRCACTVGGACDPGLTCASGLCVQYGDDDAGASDAPSAADSPDAQQPDSASLGDAAETGSPLSCATYCAQMALSCTGSYAQYADDVQCEGMCGVWALGSLADTTGDTLGCRLTYASQAAGNAAAYCPAAGPWGGNASRCSGASGQCTAFCESALARCGPSVFDGGAVYANVPACMSACAGFASQNTYNDMGPTVGNTLDCREYHLSAAWFAPGAQEPHCTHLGASSPVCQ